MAAALRKLVITGETCSSNNQIEKFNLTKVHINARKAVLLENFERE